MNVTLDFIIWGIKNIYFLNGKKIQNIFVKFKKWIESTKMPLHFQVIYKYGIHSKLKYGVVLLLWRFVYEWKLHGLGAEEDFSGASTSMEGIGSRLGRASSRYGPAATVFNGPVRRWKKKWVLASSSSSGVNYQTSSQSQSNAQKLLLCRWTPIHPSTSSEADGTAAPPEEPPRRKFRYTPVSLKLYLNPFSCPIDALCLVSERLRFRLKFFVNLVYRWFFYGWFSAFWFLVTDFSMRLLLATIHERMWFLFICVLIMSEYRSSRTLFLLFPVVLD